MLETVPERAIRWFAALAAFPAVALFLLMAWQPAGAVAWFMALPPLVLLGEHLLYIAVEDPGRRILRRWLVRG